jgi:hypothetical protein
MSTHDMAISRTAIARHELAVGDIRAGKVTLDAPRVQSLMRLLWDARFDIMTDNTCRFAMRRCLWFASFDAGLISVYRELYLKRITMEAVVEALVVGTGAVYKRWCMPVLEDSTRLHPHRQHTPHDPLPRGMITLHFAIRHSQRFFVCVVGTPHASPIYVEPPTEDAAAAASAPVEEEEDRGSDNQLETLDNNDVPKQENAVPTYHIPNNMPILVERLFYYTCACT